MEYPERVSLQGLITLVLANASPSGPCIADTDSRAVPRTQKFLNIPILLSIIPATEPVPWVRGRNAIHRNDSRSTIGLSESQTGSRTYYINNKMAVNLRYQKATRNNIPITRDYYVINIGTSPRTDVGMLPHLAYCNRLRGLWEFSTVGMSPPTTMSPFASIDAQLE